MEFELSKKLLFSYLRSSTVARVFDSNDHIIRTVLDFVTNYVLVYTENIAFLNGKHIDIMMCQVTMPMKEQIMD